MKNMAFHATFSYLTSWDHRSRTQSSTDPVAREDPWDGNHMRQIS
jgi:hypothetical protein